MQPLLQTRWGLGVPEQLEGCVNTCPVGVPGARRCALKTTCRSHHSTCMLGVMVGVCLRRCWASTPQEQQWRLHHPPPAAAEGPVVPDITRVPQYQLLAERIATASAEDWAAPISYGQPSEDDMFGVRSGTHPLAAATQLLRMVTNDVTFQVENTNSKGRGSAGFYLYHGEGSSRFRKDRKLRSKANCWDAFCAMADTRVDKYDATSAYRLPAATRDALKGLQAGIRSVLSAEMQVQLDSD